MAEDNALLWLASIVAIGILGAAVGYLLAMASAAAKASSVPTEAVLRSSVLPAMTNHEIIKWTDRKGRVHVIEVDRRVELVE